VTKFGGGEVGREWGGMKREGRGGINVSRWQDKLGGDEWGGEGGG